MRRSTKLYWSTSLKEGRQNLGDWLAPILCQRLFGLRVEYARPRHCDLMTVGSILQKAKNRPFGRRIHIWGSGLIQQRRRFRSRHYLHAVRGRKTAERIVGQPVPVYGDPGLLCDWAFPRRRREKRYTVGLIPHYVDRHHPLVKDFAARVPRATVIDILVNDAPAELPGFLDRVAECEVVLSSSLHGLIMADSLDVPNAWIRLSDLVVGNGFKYRDYYSVFGMDNLRPFDLTGSTTEADALEVAADYRRPGIQNIKRDLYLSFPFPG